MTPQQRINLLRLLKPRHVAVIGGRDAEVCAAECARIGFTGPFWPVNPKRPEIGGHRCYASIDDLPEAPDAVFLAIPREPAIEALQKLAAMGAGGVVCYTAGFGETGTDGADMEARLLEAAGDLALVGPNCYGLINYIDKVALWPFAHGGECPGYGAAIITQSGMLSSDFTMSQRSVPFAYMVSAGNQSAIRIEDFIDVLCDRDEVRVFGLHIEAIKDAVQFESVARKALKLGKPIVALKTGTSQLGSALTVSHTGSLAGTEALYDALFDRLGIIKVASPAQLLETVKLFSVAGVPKGNRIAALTCSGGGATMLADHAERVGLDFPAPVERVGEALRSLLPLTATVSNPLDYTTPIWGIPEKTQPVFSTFFDGSHDAAIILQDYPASGLDESKIYYRADTKSFIQAAKARGITAAVCSTLSENLDAETRAFLVGEGVAPMQGIHECLNAFASGAWYSRRRVEILNQTTHPLHPPCIRTSHVIDEAAGKEILDTAGIPTPTRCIVDGANASLAAVELGFPLALKMVSAGLPHKTEAGAVSLGLATADAVAEAVEKMRRDVGFFKKEALTDRFLLEKMAPKPVAELMIGIRRDPQFGFAMTLATGGMLVELLEDATTVLLPASREDISKALARLKISKLIDGYRGKSGADREAILDGLERLSALALDGRKKIEELEINPLFLLADGIIAVDVLMQIAD